jgi:hypothetical protein
VQRTLAAVDGLGMVVVANPLVVFPLPRIAHPSARELAVGLIDHWAPAIYAAGADIFTASTTSPDADPRAGLPGQVGQALCHGDGIRPVPDAFWLLEVSPRQGGFRGTFSLRDGSTLAQRTWMSFRGGARSVVDFAEAALAEVLDRLGLPVELTWRDLLSAATPRDGLATLRRTGAEGLHRREMATRRPGARATRPVLLN